ncbi:MAG: PQQ-binding-like beta-propeller repeat protein [Planctomycetes bacterium]|nr:PQQ-binding-like beta-propeller repeat protein [Planctomycetota bacterium]
MRSICLALAAALFLSLPARAEVVWPQFRGPDGQGHVDAVGVPLHWGEGKNIVWKSPVEGLGWSSPVVADGKIWLTTAIPSYVSEEERAAKVEGMSMASTLAVAREVSLWALSFDLESGKQLQKIKLFEVDSPQAIHSLNSFASPTSVLAEGRLFCHFGAFGTACVDTTTGRIIWKRELSIEHGVGPGSSPVLFEDLLIIPCDGTDQQYVVAVSTANGETVWKTDRPPLRTEVGDYQKAFCTPLIIEVGGQKQVVIPGAQWFVAYDPRTGEEVWRVDHGRGFSNVPRPVYDGERLYLCTGFVRGQLWAVRPDGAGDITETHVVWKRTKQIPMMASPIVVDGRVHVVSDGGVATCFDAATGEEIWRKRMGGKYSASPLFVEGRIYFCNHDGRTTVLAPGDEYRELAQNDLDGQLMASPVVVEGDLLLRTDTYLYRISENR